MTNKLSLYNGALRLCSQRALASLSENIEARRLLDAVWDDGAVDYCLEQGFWAFATRTVEMTANADYQPDFGFEFVFDKPEDYIKIVAICQDESFVLPLVNYVDEAEFICADIETIYFRYVSNDSAFGGNLSLWTPTFIKFVQHYLASSIIDNLSQSDQKLQQVTSMYMDSLKNARAKDAMNKPVQKFPCGSWVNARMSGVNNG